MSEDPGKHLTIVGEATESAELVLYERDLARRAYQMRMEGNSLFEIAESLKISEHKAAASIREVARSVAELVDTGAKQEILEMELARLDAMQAPLWPQASSGDTRAVETVLKIMSHRAKITGLDGASIDRRNQTVVIAGDSDAYMAAIQRAMGAQDA